MNDNTRCTCDQKSHTPTEAEKLGGWIRETIERSADKPYLALSLLHQLARQSLDNAKATTGPREMERALETGVQVIIQALVCLGSFRAKDFPLLDKTVDSWLTMVEELVSMSVSHIVDESAAGRIHGLIYDYGKLLPILDQSEKVADQALTLCDNQLGRMPDLVSEGQFGTKGFETKRMYNALAQIAKRRAAVHTRQAELYELLAGQCVLPEE